MPTPHNTENKAEVARVAITMFFNIMGKWQVKDNDQQTLLGHPAKGTFYAWKKSGATSIPSDTLERISYVMGIYRSLSIIFSNPEQAESWVSRPNKRFGDKSALEYMVSGGITELADVRYYLDAERQ
jgi:uncharacterized protein (DUF2384 family)